MYPLAHITFACGVVWAGSRLLKRSAESDAGSTPVVALATGASDDPSSLAEHARAAVRIADTVDYRLVAFGALLPDLIDKPIGRVLFRSYFDTNGHLYGHTLLFALTLLLPGIYLLVRKNNPQLLAVGVAVLAHLASDPVTHAPHTLFWPLLGWSFLPKVTLLGLWGTVVTETAAALIIIAVARSLVMRGRLGGLLQSGRP